MSPPLCAALLSGTWNRSVFLRRGVKQHVASRRSRAFQSVLKWFCPPFCALCSSRARWLPTNQDCVTGSDKGSGSSSLPAELPVGSSPLSLSAWSGPLATSDFAPPPRARACRLQSLLAPRGLCRRRHSCRREAIVAGGCFQSRALPLLRVVCVLCPAQPQTPRSDTDSAAAAPQSVRTGLWPR